MTKARNLAAARGRRQADAQYTILAVRGGAAMYSSFEANG